MNNKFDELTKSMAQSVTRRAALKKFGVGLAAMALAGFGLARNTAAGTGCKAVGWTCSQDSQCCSGYCVSRICCKPSGFCSRNSECCSGICQRDKVLGIHYCA
jgi:hypothetical protein